MHRFRLAGAALWLTSAASGAVGITRPVAIPAAAAAAPLVAAAPPIDPGTALPLPEGALDAERRLFDGPDVLSTRSGTAFEILASPPSLPSERYVRIHTRSSPIAPRRIVRGVGRLHGQPLLDRLEQIAADISGFDSALNAHRTDQPYADASSYLYSVVDNHELNGVRGVVDAYSGVFVPGSGDLARDYVAVDTDSQARERRWSMNVEHAFPQSLFHSLLPMRADLHILMTTLSRSNAMRGNLPYGPIEHPDAVNGAGAKRNQSRFEPPNFVKGRVARMLFYFYLRYRAEPFFSAPAVVEFWNSQLETLLDWNRRFPPTVTEASRNNHVERYQGNRNPFTDDYTLIDRIGGELFRIP